MPSVSPPQPSAGGASLAPATKNFPSLCQEPIRYRRECQTSRSADRLRRLEDDLAELQDEKAARRDVETMAKKLDGMQASIGKLTTAASYNDELARTVNGLVDFQGKVAKALTQHVAECDDFQDLIIRVFGEDGDDGDNSDDGDKRSMAGSEFWVLQTRKTTPNTITADSRQATRGANGDALTRTRGIMGRRSETTDINSQSRDRQTINELTFFHKF